jgi:nitroreductase
MILPVDPWYQSIFLRQSERLYSGKPAPEKDLSEIDKLCEQFRPFSGSRAKLVRNPPDDVFKGIIGSYGKVKNAPHYVAFIGDTKSPTVEEALGYMGEGIILGATALGLNTCWVAGFFHPERVMEHIDVSENEVVMAVTPIGYAEQEYDRIESLRSGHGKPHRRHALEKLVIEGSHAPKEWMRTGLEAARLAPSAVNRQPWRFLIGENTVLIEHPRTRNFFRIPYRLDCGIAMLHFELGALVAGVSGNWTLLQSPSVAEYKVA